jgi:hypothetical protein
MIFWQQALRFGAFALVASTIAACGGGDATTTAAATNSTINGSVVKGPVAGATVVFKNALNGAVLGNTTSSPSGTYSFTTTFSGDVLVEVNGGSYVDEATGRTTTLATPMRVVLATNGGIVIGMVTPLTTLAYTYSSNGGNAPSSANFSNAATLMAGQFGLTGINIVSTLPIVTGTTNAYGKVISAFSTYLNNNSSTTSLNTLVNQQMGTTTYASFNAAFASAYNQATGQTTVINFGGGTSTGGSSGSIPTTSSTTSTVSPQNTTLLAQYSGAWISGCEAFISPGLPVGTPGFPNGTPEVTHGSSKTIFSFSSPAPNGFVLAQTTENYFTSNNCTGTSVATIADTGGDLIADGTKTIGTLTVVKVQASDPGGTPTFSGSAASLRPATAGNPAAVVVTLGSFTITRSILNTRTYFKSVLSTVTNNSFQIGEDSVLLDASGYPTTFATGSSGTFTKL